MPRARLVDAKGGPQERRSTVLPRYVRMIRQIETLVAGAYRMT